jgi:hypothetical protein
MVPLDSRGVIFSLNFVLENMNGGGQRADWGKESQQYFCTDAFTILGRFSHLPSMSNLQISSDSLQTQILMIFEAAAAAGRPVSVFWVLHLHLL